MKKLRFIYLFLFFIATILSAQENSEQAEIDSLSFSEIISQRASFVMVNTNYPVTPGDRYQVSYLDSAQKFDLPFYVESDYTINLGFFGKISAKDQAFAELKKNIEEKVTTAYPNSIPNVIMVIPGTFQIQITGELPSAKLVTAWSFDRLSSLLKNRTSAFSSNRYIEILSEDGTSKYYDLFQASRYGNLEQDPYIRSGDQIILHPYYKKVTISGQVQYPGTYELLPEESLEDLINIYADGLRTFADRERVTIKRLKAESKTDGNSFYIDISDSIPENFELNDFDTVNIARVLDHRPVTYFQGAIGDTNRGTESVGFSTVSNKVSYPIVSGEKLSSAVRALQGQFSLESDLENAFILRGSDGSKVEVDIQHLLLKGGEENDAVLYDKDIIVIPFRQYLVYVGGQVTNPGAYPYIVNKSWDYYVGLAGGFNVDNHLGKRVRITDVYGNKYEQDERIVEPEDVLYAPLNHPMYWVKEYGDDVAVIAASIISTIIIVNYVSKLIDSNVGDLPTYGIPTE